MNFSGKLLLFWIAISFLLTISFVPYPSATYGTRLETKDQWSLEYFCDYLAPEVTVLDKAHAHNDYWHERPLFDALSQGFTFIEADVHLIDGVLYVSHYRPMFPEASITLASLYLQPLEQVIRYNQGRVFPCSTHSVHLMIDIKTGAEATYRAVDKLLIPYRDLLSHYDNGNYHPGALTVFVSGNRPVDLIRNQKESYIFLDGRIEDLEKNIDPYLMPVVSQKYSKVVKHKWFDQSLDTADIEYIQHLVQQVHAEGKKLRLWHSPESAAIWEALLDLDIDIINSDQLETLATFLKAYEIKNQDDIAVNKINQVRNPF